MDVGTEKVKGEGDAVVMGDRHPVVRSAVGGHHPLPWALLPLVGE